MSTQEVPKYGAPGQTQLIDPLSDKSHVSIYRSAEFRREIQAKDREAVRARRERQQARQAVKHPPRTVITVDTSKAKSNSEVVRKCIKEFHWKEYPLGRRDLNCDIFWHGLNVLDYRDYYTGQINKFPGMGEILAKINLFRTLDLMERIFPNEYDFYPRTWLLPHQHQEFCAEASQRASKRKQRQTYIVKPSEGSQGEGIYLIKDPLEYSIQGNRSHVVQEYLCEPLLLDKFKFDLRIYVLLKSLYPLEFYVAKEGMVRFCTIPYQRPTYKNLHESYMHLTNYSLNKHSTTYNPSDREDEGSKRTLSSVLAKMEGLGFDTSTVFESIERVICKTLIAIAPELQVAHQAHLPAGKPGPSCFQILGFDIILLRDLKPMLLEVNSCPSLRTVCEQEVSPGVVTFLPSLKDMEIKQPVIRDTLLLVAPQDKLHVIKQQEKEQRRFRRRQRVWKQRAKNNRNVNNSDNDNKKEEQTEEDTTMAVSELTESIKATSINVVSESDSPPASGRKKSVFDNPVKRPMSTPMELFEFHDGDGELDDPVILRTKPCEQFRLDSDTEDENGHSDFDPEEDSCLKQLYPAIYQEEYERLRILEKVAHIFMTSLGIKGSWRIGLTGFRMFTRKCRLGRKKLSSAAIDIMYIDFQKKWDYMNPDRTSGLCYQGFVDAFFEIAKRKFYSSDTTEMLENLVDYCEANMQHGSHSAPYVNRRLLGRRGRDHQLRLSYDDSLLQNVRHVHISVPTPRTYRNRGDFYASSFRWREPKE